ncbi:PREDICTED: uncharacterized protein LOC101310873 [Fragaria vesca subsp. vesca]
MDCPPGFTLKRKRTEKNSGTSTSNMADGQALPGVGEGHLDKGFHLKIKAGGKERPNVAPPNVVPPIIRNVTRKDLAVPAVHSMLYLSGSRNMPHRDVKKEVPAAPDQSESPGKKSPSAAVPPPANP